MKKSLGIIMTVDDMVSIREMVDYIVSTLGFETVKASNGVEGLQRFKELKEQLKPLKLIISDINMPIMSGLEFIREIRKIDKHTPILMMTTETDSVLIKEGKQAGANGWAVKPVNIEDLKETIELLTGVDIPIRG